jgi:drug/metabolite transporter (DMT)-like permease
MEPAVILVVLAGALSTALMGCALKNQPDPLAASLLVSLGSGVVALPLLFVTGLPGAEALPWLAASTVMSAIYWTVIGRAYASGDISIVFPLAFGSAPILVLILSSLLVNEIPASNQLAVILIISAGLLLVLLSGLSSGVLRDRKLLVNCFLVTCVICGYTMIDALGARVSGKPIAYTVFIYASGALVNLIYALTCQRQRILAAAKTGWVQGLVWGAVSLSVYAGELWAMTRAPIALVAALRESSILFATLIAVMWLREPLKPSRIAGAGVVALGLAFMRLA